MKFIEHLNKHTIGQMNGLKYLDFVVHFDFSHEAPSWQRARFYSMIHLRSLDSNKQAGPSWQRPGFKEATRALKILQNAEGQGVPFIPVKSRTRQNNTLNPELQEFLEWLSFH